MLDLSDSENHTPLQFDPRHLEGHLGMELIINGNQAGYNWLCGEVEAVIDEGIDDPWQNRRINEDWAHVVKRSVFLNIRGPVSIWGASQMPDHWELVHKRAATYLPPDIGWLDPADMPYEPVDPGSNFLKLD